MIFSTSATRKMFSIAIAVAILMPSLGLEKRGLLNDTVSRKLALIPESAFRGNYRRKVDEKAPLLLHTNIQNPKKGYKTKKAAKNPKIVPPQVHVTGKHTSNHRKSTGSPDLLVAAAHHTKHNKVKEKNSISESPATTVAPHSNVSMSSQTTLPSKEVTTKPPLADTSKQEPDVKVSVLLPSFFMGLVFNSDPPHYKDGDISELGKLSSAYLKSSLSVSFENALLSISAFPRWNRRRVLQENMHTVWARCYGVASFLDAAPSRTVLQEHIVNAFSSNKFATFLREESAGTFAKVESVEIKFDLKTDQGTKNGTSSASSLQTYDSGKTSFDTIMGVSFALAATLFAGLAFLLRRNRSRSDQKNALQISFNTRPSTPMTRDVALTPDQHLDISFGSSFEHEYASEADDLSSLSSIRSSDELSSVCSEILKTYADDENFGFRNKLFKTVQPISSPSQVAMDIICEPQHDEVIINASSSYADPVGTSKRLENPGGAACHYSLPMINELVSPGDVLHQSSEPQQEPISRDEGDAENAARNFDACASNNQNQRNEPGSSHFVSSNRPPFDSTTNQTSSACAPKITSDTVTGLQDETVNETTRHDCELESASHFKDFSSSDDAFGALRNLFEFLEENEHASTNQSEGGDILETQIDKEIADSSRHSGNQLDRQGVSISARNLDVQSTLRGCVRGHWMLHPRGRSLNN